jgi:hypothetical protein
MKRLIALALLLVGCSTIAPIIGGAIGGATGSLGGPGLAAAGAATGVAVGQTTFPDSEEQPVLAGASQGETASTIKETSNLIETASKWYLIIFILIPFLSKRFRGWIKTGVPKTKLFSKKEDKL